MNEEILVLEIDDHSYGLGVKHVREVLRAVALSPVPDVHDFAEGVLNLRGRSVAVINVRRRFGFPDRPINPSDYLIVMQMGERLSAMRVDRAVDLMPIDDGLLEPVDGNITSQPAVRGIVKFGSRVVYLLDPEQLLSEPEHARLDQFNAVDGSRESGS